MVYVLYVSFKPCLIRKNSFHKMYLLSMTHIKLFNKCLVYFHQLILQLFLGVTRASGSRPSVPVTPKLIFFIILFIL